MSKQPPPAPTASAVGPCPNVIQIVGRPGTGSLPSTITPPDHSVSRTRFVSQQHHKSGTCWLSQLFPVSGQGVSTNSTTHPRQNFSASNSTYLAQGVLANSTAYLGQHVLANNTTYHRQGLSVNNTTYLGQGVSTNSFTDPEQSVLTNTSRTEDAASDIVEVCMFRYAPDFEEVDVAYCFGTLCLSACPLRDTSITVKARILELALMDSA